MNKGCLKIGCLWLFVYPLLFVFALTGLAFYGVATAIIGATLAFYSSGFRSWLITQRGYAHRLSKLPGFENTSPTTLAIASLTYLLPLSAISWLLMGGAFSDIGTTLTAAVMGIFGITFLYGGLIRGWGLTPTTPDVTAEITAAEERYFQRIEQLDQIKVLDPIAFERFVGSLFERMGYIVQTTAVSGDEGIDLSLRRENKTAVVQCKRYTGTVGQPVVRDLYGAMVHNRADEAYLVTTGTISLPAQQWAAEKPIHLVDGNALVEWLESFKETTEEPEDPETSLVPVKFSLDATINFLRQNGIAAGALAMGLIFPIFCCLAGLLAFYHPGATPRVTPTLTMVPIEAPTMSPTELSSTETPTELLPTETPTESLPAETPTKPPMTKVPPTETPIPEVLKPVVTAIENTVNIRSGPGTDYEVVGVLLSGESLEIVGRNADSSWWQVSTPKGLAWIAASVVTASNIEGNVPVVEIPSPSIKLTPTTQVPTSTNLPLPEPTTPSGPTFTGDTVDPPWWPCEQGQIKGNRNSMIYHTPSGSFYTRTYENVECFNTAEEAKAAGYRASKR